MEVNLKKYPFVQNGIAFTSLARRSFQGEKIEVHNCKKIFVPLFVYVGIEVLDTIEDESICSKIPNITEYCKSLSRGELRVFLEAVASSNALFSDALYQIDFDEIKPIDYDNGMLEKYKVPISCWQSYGRSYILDLDKRISSFKSDKKKALILPCIGQKPYNHSHLNIPNYNNSEWHKIVVSSIGIIPEEFWLDKAVMTYQTGMPDIWRVFNLCKNYLENNQYEEFEIWLDYTPYIEIFEYLQKLNNYNIKFFGKKEFSKPGPKFSRRFE